MVISSRRLIVCLVFALIALFAGCRKASPNTENEPIVEVSPEELDFGFVYATNQFQWKLHLKNPGSQPATVLDLKSSCGCVSIAPRSLFLSPGETREVQLTLDLTGIRGKLDDNTTPNYAVQVRAVIEKRSGHPLAWTLGGRVRPLIEISQSSVRFDDDLTERPPIAAKKLLINSAVPLKSLDLDYDAQSCRLELTKKSAISYALSINPSPTLPVGPFEFSVSLVPTAPSGQVARLSIPVFGRVRGDVEAFPDPLILGEAKVGGTLEQLVELKARVPLVFRVQSILPDSQGMVATMGSAVNGRITVAVRQTVLAPGHQHGRIKFVLREDKKGVREITLPTFYYGLEL